MATLTSTGRFAAGEACADNDILYGPYSTVSAAHAALLNAEQNVVGRTVGIQTGNNIEEYWYQGGTTEQHLVKKQAASVEVDENPTQGSPNPVSSGGVYTELGKKGTYSKPSEGIPSTDLASDVQTSLGKADTALQQHQDISGKQDKSNIRTSFQTTPDDVHYPSEKLVKDSLNGKVDTELGKGLSTNDYDNTEKAKVAGAVQNITRGGSTLSKTDGVVDIPEEIQTVVATPVAPGGSPSANLSNGTLTLGLVSGSDGHNPNLGTFVTSDSGATFTPALPSAPSVASDYIVVVDKTDPSDVTSTIWTWDTTLSIPAWASTGRDANMAYFKSGELITEVNIVNDLNTGGANNVLSAEQGKKIGNDISNMKMKSADALNTTAILDFAISDENGNVLAEFKDGYVKTKNFNSAEDIAPLKTSDSEENALYITDGYGNVVVEFKDGQVKTKNFNSAEVSKRYGNFSILGDSWSAFKDYVTPSTNGYYYPTTDPNAQGHNAGELYGHIDVLTPEQMWWWLFATQYKSRLIQNNSYGGSTIANSHGVSYSFLTRMNNIGESPELIIILGTRNDDSLTELGDYKYSGWTEQDLTTYRPAVAKLLDYLQHTHVGSTILFACNSANSDKKTSAETICEHYNVPFLQLTLTSSQTTNSHPNSAGMEYISNSIITKLNSL